MVEQAPFANRLTTMRPRHVIRSELRLPGAINLSSRSLAMQVSATWDTMTAILNEQSGEVDTVREEARI